MEEWERKIKQMMKMKGIDKLFVLYSVVLFGWYILSGLGVWIKEKTG